VKARARVKVVYHPEWPSGPQAVPAHLIIRTKEGKEYSGERNYPIGSSEEPLTIEQVRQLYTKYTKGILPEEQIAITAEAILNLENLGDVEELMHTLTFSRNVRERKIQK